MSQPAPPHPSSDISETDVHYKAQRQEWNTSKDIQQGGTVDDSPQVFLFFVWLFNIARKYCT